MNIQQLEKIVLEKGFSEFEKDPKILIKKYDKNKVSWSSVSFEKARDCVKLSANLNIGLPFPMVTQVSYVLYSDNSLLVPSGEFFGDCGFIVAPSKFFSEQARAKISSGNDSEYRRDRIFGVYTPNKKPSSFSSLNVLTNLRDCDLTKPDQTLKALMDYVDKNQYPANLVAGCY